jgi:hypothetical protein
MEYNFKKFEKPLNEKDLLQYIFGQLEGSRANKKAQIKIGNERNTAFWEGVIMGLQLVEQKIKEK